VEGDCRIVTELRCEVGEGPVWIPERHELWWVDIPVGRLHVLDLRSGAVRTSTLGNQIGAVVPRANGGIVAAVDTCFLLLDPQGGVERRIPVQRGAGSRFNDAKIDPTGRLVAGMTSPEGVSAGSSVFRLDQTGCVDLLLNGLRLSNGLDWSADGGTFYLADSLAEAIYAFDYDLRSGAIENCRCLIEVSDGLPDGLAVDERDTLWVAIWGGSCVRQYSQAGDLLAEHGLPTAQVTSCVFGGDELDTLFVTSARSEGEDDGVGGSLFALKTSTRGRRSNRFAG
jgi:sugar lactone lactonase YvrE